jgi:hypothetical protein
MITAEETIKELAIRPYQFHRLNKKQAGELSGEHPSPDCY